VSSNARARSALAIGQLGTPEREQGMSLPEEGGLDGVEKIRKMWKMWKMSSNLNLPSGLLASSFSLFSPTGSRR
jgi:hypothetical protein